MTIRIHGRTLATAVLARCLRQKGAEVVLAEATQHPHRGSQYICINDVAISLLGDLFPGIWTTGADLGHDLVMREVIWGDDAIPQRIRQQGKVIDVGVLTNRLFALLEEIEVDDDTPRTTTWHVNPAAGADQQLQTGDRAMLTARVELTRPLDPPRSMIESLTDGWMFLAPINRASCILQAMVPRPVPDARHKLKSMLDQSALIAPQVAAFEQAAQFPAAPAIRLSMAEAGKIFVGTPAARLDPISGEGAPFAIRTAILAAAVLTHDGPAAEAIDYYQQRILTSFLSHLSGCQTFYADAFFLDADWQLELRKSGIARSVLAPVLRKSDGMAPKLRLEGLSLVAAKETASG
ncbi:hypothetical protein ROG8370_03153 [Roseovarius gaetbuli]|uniref:Uncharacterized protein n=1 Tax=Roseovarius gaetbuli TaxID=1356575 RepID=A0A1X7A1R6_9RHOB|nr:hypothetical protein [Roseovarius gaetbuli]SLN67613.1 hypothetical protein ROG8370_03153 [Roseovarius gaetbuli]